MLVAQVVVAGGHLQWKVGRLRVGIPGQLLKQILHELDELFSCDSIARLVKVEHVVIVGKDFVAAVLGDAAEGGSVVIFINRGTKKLHLLSFFIAFRKLW